MLALVMMARRSVVNDIKFITSAIFINKFDAVRTPATVGAHRRDLSCFQVLLPECFQEAWSLACSWSIESRKERGKGGGIEQQVHACGCKNRIVVKLVRAGKPESAIGKQIAWNYDKGALLGRRTIESIRSLRIIIKVDDLHAHQEWSAQSIESRRGRGKFCACWGFTQLVIVPILIEKIGKILWNLGRIGS